MIAILVVANVHLYREGLAASINSMAGLHVAATAVDCDSTLTQLQVHSPDVVLVDTGMRDAIEIMDTVGHEAGSTKVIAFAVQDEHEVIRYAEAGAAGYVPCSATFDELITVITSVARGELVCSPRVASMLFRRLAQQAAAGHQGDKSVTLTARERQVLELIREGRSNKEIAHALHIAEATAKNHVHRLLEKLKVTSRTQAAGWVPAMRGWRAPVSNLL